jgi:hypothetical protein
VKYVVTRWIVGDEGQDLIEYALLCGFIGIVGLLIFPEIADAVSAGYVDWVESAKDLWEPCAPAPAPCP